MNVNPKYRNVYVVGFFILSSVTAYLTFLVSVHKNVFAQSFYYYSSILVMWASVFIFMYIKSFNCSVVGGWTNKIAVVSLPIYGVHPLILELFITENLRISNVLLDTFLITLITFFISMFIGFGINKIDRKRWLS
ncbi:O-acetyltransferase WecH [compost metagenome]